MARQASPKGDVSECSFVRGISFKPARGILYALGLGLLGLATPTPKRQRRGTFDPKKMMKLSPSLMIAGALVNFIVLAAVPVIAQDQPVLRSQPQRVFARPTALEISPKNAAKVARQVWLNETGGNRKAITAWNATEDFASLGIGHFIWFSEGLETRFEESFPDMLAYLRRKGARLPPWLDKDPIPPSPWRTKAQFDRAFNSARMVGLRRFLLATMDLQAQYLVVRLNNALPRILADLNDRKERAHVKRQFERVVAASPDLYPLIDYVNFKGEGISDSETFPNRRTGVPEGWGLKHVLLAMTGRAMGTEQVLRDFSEAARFVLRRRITNNPRDRRWQRGWMRRVATYRRPLP
jgi:hypothetical protein